MARPNCISAFPFLDARSVGEVVAVFGWDKKFVNPTCFWMGKKGKPLNYRERRNNKNPPNEFCCSGLVTGATYIIYYVFYVGNPGNFLSPSFTCTVNRQKSSGASHLPIRCSGGSTRIGSGFLHPKFNSEVSPEKWWLESYFPFRKVTFQGRAVKLQVGNT